MDEENFLLKQYRINRGVEDMKPEEINEMLLHRLLNEAEEIRKCCNLFKVLAIIGIVASIILALI